MLLYLHVIYVILIASAMKIVQQVSCVNAILLHHVLCSNFFWHAFEAYFYFGFSILFLEENLIENENFAYFEISRF